MLALKLGKTRISLQNTKIWLLFVIVSPRLVLWAAKATKVGICISFQQHGRAEPFAIIKTNDASSNVVKGRLHMTRVMTRI